MFYKIFLRDNAETNIIKISEEQMKLFEWLKKNDFFEFWKEECEGSIEIFVEGNEEIIDLTK